jgi:hypothetical protein
MIGLAVCPFRVNWPVTYTLVLIKVKSRGASVFFGYTIHTSIEHVANAWLRMSIKSVQTWAKIICAPRFLKLKTILAIDVEIMVTGFSLPA